MENIVTEGFQDKIQNVEGEVKSRASEIMSMAQERGKQLLEATKSFVEKQPLAVAGGALGLGIGLGITITMLMTPKKSLWQRVLFG